MAEVPASSSKPGGTKQVDVGRRTLPPPPPRPKASGATIPLHPGSNFDFLEQLDPTLARLGRLAEQFLDDDPSTALIKLRQFGETLAQQIAELRGMQRYRSFPQADLLEHLRWDGVSAEIMHALHFLRITGNRAVHGGTGSRSVALDALKRAWELGVWYTGQRNDGVPAEAPTFNLALKGCRNAELSRLRHDLDAARANEKKSAQALAKSEREAWHLQTIARARRRLARRLRESGGRLDTLKSDSGKRDVLRAHETPAERGRWRLMMAMVVMLASFVVAVPPASALTSSHTSCEGWQLARWGMTPLQVACLYPSAEPLRNGEALALHKVLVHGTAFRVLLRFKNGSLHDVLMSPRRGLSRQMAQFIGTELAHKYGGTLHEDRESVHLEGPVTFDYNGSATGQSSLIYQSPDHTWPPNLNDL